MGLSTHVLDTAAGRPAAGVPVRLERGLPPQQAASPEQAGVWTAVASGVTDADGRLAGLPLTAPGRWRLVFDTHARSAFFPEVTITFAVTDPAEHHHVPLLLAPFGYSTYRGS
ncbi:5-hydroxyisourate hydrolase [Frankia canadensis]|uniref:5-hydroxyisourate hydrolase n=1 Tax=Frankia canadensis TaxID=1836972 RepID=A0A2I2KL68_9ACTN|nr:hydroxyisourate hydrolase [Frankia canadensis]SNQ46405.1 5-hydroxyisourate hydrolase [Frankia canadensis]SOU53695.1 5-hydroxyisourate hydrolase [Frankia canadensis]